MGRRSNANLSLEQKQRELDDAVNEIDDRLERNKRKLGLDEKFHDSFTSWIDADYWLYGLLYHVVFLGESITNEQKLKCICWEMATYDYGYRYQYLKKNYGECSAYSDKSSIYKDLAEMVRKMDKDFDVDMILKSGKMKYPVALEFGEVMDVITKVLKPMWERMGNK